MQVTEKVSWVSSFAPIREHLLRLQQALAQKNGVVMDGRDIGTHVLPNAAVKLFLTATLSKRVERRYQELRLSEPHVTREAIEKNLLARDTQDKQRIHAPLRQAADAVVIDNTNLSIEELVAMTFALVEKRIEKK